MFETAFGLPLHPLVVHAVVVFLPLACVAVLATAFLPRLRAWAGPVPLILAAGSTALVPVATSSGTFFVSAIGAESNPAVQQHQSLGESMLWWSLGLLVAAGLLYWWHRELRAGRRHDEKPLMIAVLAVAVVASVGALVHVVRVGDSGTRAGWGYVTEQSE